MQHAERDNDGNLKDLRMRMREMTSADALQSNTIVHMLDNVGLYENIDERKVNADLPQRLCYASIEDRIASMANPSEIIGDIEIVATARCLQRPVHVCVGESVLEFGTEFQESGAIMLKYINLSEDAGHCEALVPITGQLTDQPELVRKVTTPAIMSPIPKPAISRVKRRTTKSEIINSSPYKKL